MRQMEKSFRLRSLAVKYLHRDKWKYNILHFKIADGADVGMYACGHVELIPIIMAFPRKRSHLKWAVIGRMRYFVKMEK
jgi:hypothetical protein